MTFMEESSEENLSCILTTKFSIRSWHRNILKEADVFWMKLKQNFLAAMSKGMFGEKRVQNFMKRTPLQLLSMGVGRSCFGLVLAWETFHSMRVNGKEAVCTEAGKGQFDSWV